VFGICFDDFIKFPVKMNYRIILFFCHPCPCPGYLYRYCLIKPRYIFWWRITICYMTYNIIIIYNILKNDARAAVLVSIPILINYTHHDYSCIGSINESNTMAVMWFHFLHHGRLVFFLSWFAILFIILVCNLPRPVTWLIFVQ